MLFGRCTSEHFNMYKITINSREINRVKETKFLGVVLDDKLQWNQHIKRIENKILQGIGMMYQSKGRLNAKSLLILYNSIIFPYLYYCVEVWGNTCKFRLNKLKKVQKQAIRVISKLKYRDSTNSSFFKNNILKFGELIEFKTFVFIYKATRYLLPLSLHGLTKGVQQIHSHNTRNSLNMYTNKYKSFIKRMSPCVQGVKWYNYLPKNVKTCPNLVKFKQSLKRHLLEQYKTV